MADHAEEFILRPNDERPIIRLSVRLIETYREINRRYYEARDRIQAEGVLQNNGYDDEHHDYIVHNNDIFHDRYTLKARIGKGSFGQVVSAIDNHTKKSVAIKIIKSRRAFFNQAQTEIKLLELIKSADPNAEHNLVQLIDRFVFRDHQCLVFELLSINLYELLKNSKFEGVSLNLIRKFANQILKALEFLSRPDIDIIHCDLKPENILLRYPKKSSLMLIDFGSSCKASQPTYTYIQSRFYRSPEVLLGLKYNQKIDIWSLACVLVEMHTGEPLFGGVDQVDQMCRIVDVLGMPPLSMLETSPPDVLNKYFYRVDLRGNPSSHLVNQAWNDLVQLPAECDPECSAMSADRSIVYVLRRPRNAERDNLRRPRTLESILGVHIGGPQGRRFGEAGHSEDRYLEFLDFIRPMLLYDPAARHSATQASVHIFLGAGAVAARTANVSAIPSESTQGGVSCSSYLTTHPISASNGAESTQQFSNFYGAYHASQNRGSIPNNSSSSTMQEEVHQDVYMDEGDRPSPEGAFAGIGDKRRGRNPIAESRQRPRSAPTAVSSSNIIARRQQVSDLASAGTTEECDTSNALSSERFSESVLDSSLASHTQYCPSSGVLGVSESSYIDTSSLSTELARHTLYDNSGDEEYDMESSN